MWYRRSAGPAYNGHFTGLVGIGRTEVDLARGNGVSNIGLMSK